MGNLLEKNKLPSNRCEKCGKIFQDHIHKVLDSKHQIICSPSTDVITYDELLQYLTPSEGEYVEAIFPIRFDQILVPTKERHLFKPILVKDRSDIIIYIKNMKSNPYGMRIIIRCKECKNCNRFMKAVCSYPLKIVEVEDKLTEILYMVSNKLIPPCICKRKETEECVICMDKMATIYLAPCGHTVFCTKCDNVYFKVYSICPICRVTVLKRIVLNKR